MMYTCRFLKIVFDFLTKCMPMILRNRMIVPMMVVAKPYLPYNDGLTSSLALELEFSDDTKSKEEFMTVVLRYKCKLKTKQLQHVYLSAKFNLIICMDNYHFKRGIYSHMYLLKVQCPAFCRYLDLIIRKDAHTSHVKSNYGPIMVPAILLVIQPVYNESSFWILRMDIFITADILIS